ncbi:hypothetical protein CC2G_008309 [Coprinopsis cinerea AmutBmut pab1-1]|nr:hypothetical protein CC2G_008309 [Coprinopsis cinerea AmutBmut pab1-1]
MDLQNYWNAQGECIPGTPYPSDYGVWHSDQATLLGRGTGSPIAGSDEPNLKVLELDPLENCALEKVKELLGSSVVKMRLLTDSALTHTSEITLEDGRIFILQFPLPPFNEASSTNEEDHYDWLTRKFRAEIAILGFLKNHCPDLAIPEVVTSDLGLTDYVPLIVKTKTEGERTLNCYGSLSFEAKKQAATSYAEQMIKLFRIGVPQGVYGSLLPCEPTSDNTLGEADVTPRFSLPYLSPSTTFTTFDSHIDAFASLELKLKKSIESAEAYAQSRITINRLTNLIKSLYAQLPADQHLHRMVLKHDDLHVLKVYLDPSSGNVKEIPDWEHHSLQPGVLAAEYPEWLRFEGHLDPRFGTQCMWWMASEDESALLREVYEVFVKEKDAEYYDCLVKGRTIRQCVSWLCPEGDDVGCERLQRWLDATFGEVVEG